MNIRENKPIKDIVGWDTVNWGGALLYLDDHLPDTDVGNLTALELGSGFNGGLSLWLALKGMRVMCSGWHPNYIEASDEPKSIHKAYRVDKLIEYREIDATNIPYKNSYDIVCYKSMLGGIIRNGSLDIARNVVNEIYDSLKPGGILLFLENIVSTRLHAIFRNKYGAGRNKWRYFSIIEIEYLHKQFHSFEYQTFGFLACFGTNELQRTALGRIDRILSSRILPKKWNYILAGVATKERSV